MGKHMTVAEMEAETKRLNELADEVEAENAARVKMEEAQKRANKAKNPGGGLLLYGKPVHLFKKDDK